MMAHIVLGCSVDLLSPLSIPIYSPYQAPYPPNTGLLSKPLSIQKGTLPVPPPPHWLLALVLQPADPGD